MILRALSLLFIAISSTLSAQVTSDHKQAIIGVADTWDSSTVKISLLERNNQGQWVRVMGPYSGRLGRAGLVWGHGLHDNPRGATTKREGDWRTPAGIFAIGGLYTTTKTPVKKNADMKEVRVGPSDLWVSDVTQPKLYNRHIRLKRPAQTAWEKNELMRQNDHAHSIKLLIHHNTDECKLGAPRAGAGSSIFFHIWRKNGATPSAGCTTMDEKVLRAIIARLDPDKEPIYVIMPKKEYLQYRQAWRLP